MISIIENNFSAIGRYWGSLNSSLQHSGSIWSMNTGIDSADLNWIWNTKPLTGKDTSQINSIKKMYAKAGLPFWWWVFPQGKSKVTDEILRAEGFNLLEKIPGMAADLNALPDKPHLNDDLQIVLVKDRQGLLLWDDVSFRGFEMHRSAQSQYSNFTLSFDLNDNSPQKLFLACLNGQPVASSLLFIHENTGGIYFVSTLPEYRNKAIGLTLTSTTLQYAKDAGAQFATLQSAPAGFSVYQRAGFSPCCHADVYCLPF